MPPPVTSISEIGRHDGETVIIRGWLYNLRESGKLLFPIFRDGTGVIQGVVVINSKFHNVPATMGNDWPLRTPGNARTEQFFFASH